ncbi:GNAT family N-acetyltransferase [Paenibacillus marinisediminis]
MFYYNVNRDIKLRMLELRHTDELYALADRNREYLGEWLMWIHRTSSPKQLEDYIEFTLKQYASHNGFNCGIFYQDRLAGCTGFHSVDWQNKKTSIGYWLGAEFQGLGIMTASCRELIQYAFTEMELNRVEIRAGVHNAKSRAIPERLGFTNEGTIRQAEWLGDRYVDHIVYGMLACDWTYDK